MNNVIDGRQKKIFRILEIAISIIGWICLIVFSVQVFLLFIDSYLPHSPLLNKLNIFGIPPFQVQQVVLVSLVSLLVCIFILNLWKNYNFEKFGKLKRRKFSADVTESEISSYFGLPITEIEKMQNEKWIELEKTIV